MNSYDVIPSFKQSLIPFLTMHNLFFFFFFKKKKKKKEKTMHNFYIKAVQPS